MTVAIRPATSDDTGDIRAVVDASFRSSYSLSPLEIDVIVDNSFTDAALTERIEDHDSLLLVAEADDDAGESVVAGFAELETADMLRWLHVSPAFRGQRVGTALFERVQSESNPRNCPLRARVLETASEGRQFLERFGLFQTETDSLDLGGDHLEEHVYTTTGERVAPNDPDVEVPSSVTDDDETVRLDHDESVPGTLAPFFVLFETDSSFQRYGYFCSHCGSTDVVADGLDRLKCQRCRNTHRADRWDRAYL
ncbi:GNAT family N-acetyltransferase [Haloferax namakaokahaiae]|uniref:GNAT family N-acetyltransferase n=1 Tax=Haloferax namakaokahaiae TaxID=1748331 RepID=A0ABD5ZD41_9EURY